MMEVNIYDRIGLHLNANKMKLVLTLIEMQIQFIGNMS